MSLDFITRVDASLLQGIYINVKSPAYGAVGDGVIDDTAAIQAAIDAAKTIGSATIYFPKGTYKVTSALNLFEWKGLKMLGDGRFNTQIVATNGNSAVQGNGVWYSQFEGLRFSTSATLTSKAVFELDGNYGGGTTQGVQANTFKDCLFEGNVLTPYVFAVCRQGGSSAQGSENLFLNCHFSGATEACYYQNGFNALNNTIIGGNFQSFSKHGIFILAGSIQIFSSAFQSTYQYAQIVNGGYDIDCSSAGVGEQIVVAGCRTESLRFYHGSGSQTPILMGNNQSPSRSEWTATSALALNTIVVEVSPSGVRKLYRVTTAGTTGATEPTWPASGTVNDGTVVWTLTEFNVVDMGAGIVGEISNHWTVGNVSAVRMGTAPAPTVRDVIGPATYNATLYDEFIMCDTTSGNVTVTLPTSAPFGKRYYVKKTATDANTVSVQQSDGGFMDFNAAHTTIPGGTRGFITAEWGDPTAFGNRYLIQARSWANESSSNFTIPAANHLKVGTNQVVAARQTGWGAPTGTATRTTYAAFAGQTISSPPTQAEVQAIDDHVKILSQRLKGLIDDLTTHGLIGP